nr:MAG TPA: hypothetical protein [Caudoviricetes sp.]
MLTFCKRIYKNFIHITRFSFRFKSRIRKRNRN